MWDYSRGDFDGLGDYLSNINWNESLGDFTNKHIKGIQVRNVEYKLCQFADDTILLLDGNTPTLDAVMDTLHNFAQVSGLVINDD